MHDETPNAFMRLLEHHVFAVLAEDDAQAAAKPIGRRILAAGRIHNQHHIMRGMMDLFGIDDSAQRNHGRPLALLDDG